MVVTSDKEPLHCYISYANEHDATAAKKYLPALKEKSSVVGDKGYVSKKLFNFLTKLKLFITAYSMDCFLKLSDEQQKQLAI